MKKILLTTVSAGLMAMAGPVLAQTGGAASGTGAPAAGTQMERQSTAPGTGAPAAGTQTDRQATTGGMQVPPPEAVGEPLRGADGMTIGMIEAVDEKNVIVSVDQAMGLGERQVSIPWDQVIVDDKTTGQKVEFQTNLTKEEIRDMPQYRGAGTGAATPGARPAR
jgi:hypothetical protein